jgi:hypothetical protein
MICALLLLAAQTRLQVEETAGLARVNEPVTVTVQGKRQTYFVTIGARQKRVFPLTELGPKEQLKVAQTSPAGFQVENSVFAADASLRIVSGVEEDSGTVRALTYKPRKATLLRTQNRMHWAPSFQRTGARGYTSMAMWSPVQQVEREVGAGWFTVRRAGSHSLYPEIKLWSEYRFFSHVPYFLFEARLDIVSAIDMFWLRGQEMTMDDLFTHLVAPDEQGRPQLLTFGKKKPLPADSWIAFVNLDKGYGFGAVPLSWSASTKVNAHLSLDDGANNGKYWDRHIISRVSTPLKPGDRFTESTAFVLFRPRPNSPAAGFLEWRDRLLNPLRAAPLR